LNNWIIAQTKEGGTIKHTVPPFFSARWITGCDPEEVSALKGPFWSDEGTGSGEDTIYIFGFEWSDLPRMQAQFERLMRQAARAIDAWISGKL
jgi:hypothetical protein